MERLTKFELTNGFPVCYPESDSGLPILVTKSNPYRKIVEKLKEYEDLEEKGKLLKLPCAVGDTVYSFSFYRVLTMHVESFITYKDHVDAVLVSDTPENPFLKFDVDIKELVKRWFLTSEEAEAVISQQGR